MAKQGDGLSGHDKQQAALRDTVTGANPDSETPEGLKRERKGAYDKDVGRNEKAAQVSGRPSDKA